MSKRKNRKVASNFENGIQHLNTGLSTAEGGRLEVNQLGYMVDIEKNHIYDIKYIDDDDYTSMCIEKENERDAMKIKNKYQGITDDRFLHYENKISNNLQEQSDFYKGKLMPYDARYNAFSRNALSVRQETGTFERGQEPYKQKELESTIFGRKNTDADFRELKYGTMYGAEHIHFKRPVPVKDKPIGGIDFAVVLEGDIRRTYGLMNGNKENSVIEYVDNAFQEFTKNELNNAGNNYSGRFQGGFERRSMLDDIANNRSGKEEYMFDMTPRHVETDSYYFDYGLKKIADDVLVDVFSDHDPDNDNFLHLQI
jgi:hypothetical protein